MHDNLKGGDIDLFALGDKATVTRLSQRRHEILADIKTAIGDRKVDLVFATEGEIANDPALVAMRQGAVEIGRWEGCSVDQDR